MLAISFENGRAHLRARRWRANSSGCQRQTGWNNTSTQQKQSSTAKMMFPSGSSQVFSLIVVFEPCVVIHDSVDQFLLFIRALSTSHNTHETHTRVLQCGASCSTCAATAVRCDGETWSPKSKPALCRNFLVTGTRVTSK